MTPAEGEWMFWAAVGIALFVCLYAAAHGDPGPDSTMDL